MKIPEFQPNQPGQQGTEAASPIGPRRANISGSVGGPAAYANPVDSALPPGEAVQAVDAVVLSSLSRAIFDEPAVNARVESLEKAYTQGSYSVNPEELARTLLQTFLPERSSGEPSLEPSPRNNQPRSSRS
ncbi:MAG: flagellar biosynthesis anti-sigma factor FlgM [Bryobacterales bacterium]|nr:flagellar biosynthesis anti-sigma factor FlgM [Bryobacterales bacterium]